MGVEKRPSIFDFGCGNEGKESATAATATNSLLNADQRGLVVSGFRQSQSVEVVDKEIGGGDGIQMKSNYCS